MKLCGMCNKPAVGKGRILPGKMEVYVCEQDKHKIVDFKSLTPPRKEERK